MRVLLVLGIMLAACLAGLPWHSFAASDPPEKRQVSVEELIRRLGSQEFKEREEATRLLLERKDALPALRKIVEAGTDLELARRAAFILEEVPRRQARRMLDRLRALAKAGAVDQCAELLARWPKGREEAACWEVTRDLARKLSGFHKTQGRLEDGKFLLDLVEAPQVISATRVTKLPGYDGESTLFIRGGEVCPKGGDFGIGVITSSGPARIERFAFGVIFAGGPVEVDGKGDMLIVSDGDVTLRNGAFRSVIMARGTVRAEHVLTNCLVVSGKTVVSPFVKPQYAYENCTIKQNEPFPLGFVRFFDPAREGVTVEPADGGVRVQGTEVGTPFARAGLRAGDVIMTVAGAASGSPEVFRRLLRRAWVGDEAVALQVIRDGKTLQILVPAPR